MKRVSLLTLVLAAGCATAAPPAGELQPQDFARGRPVTIAGNQPFFRVDLPSDVFTETAWPDLRDLRVFNAAAEPVPFARLAPPQQYQSQIIPLQQFQLTAGSPGGTPQIELEARAQGIELRMAPSSAPSVGAEYLLASPEADVHKVIDRLRLTWREHSSNWQQRVIVSVSSDLSSWAHVAIGRPIMDLKTDEGERLRQDEIEITPTTRETARYWRIRFDPGFAPRLTGVEGEATIAGREPDPVTIPTAGTREADGSARYELPALQPVSRLRITPAVPNSVLPVRIEGRLKAGDAWQPLARTIVYRVNAGDGSEYASSPLRLNGTLVRELRLRPIGAGWGSSIPAVEVERDQLVLIVNARGSGPFLIAWGSRIASDAALDIASLVPGYTDGSAFDFPVAALEAPQVLGGPSRLTDLAPAERAKQWQTILVWIGLIGGAGALAFLAIRLWREMNTGRSTPNDA